MLNDPLAVDILDLLVIAFTHAVLIQLLNISELYVLRASPYCGYDVFSLGILFLSLVLLTRFPNGAREFESNTYVVPSFL